MAQGQAGERTGSAAVVHRLQAALAAGRLGVWEWDSASDRISWNAELEEIFGIAPGTFPGTFAAIESYIHPDDRAYAAEQTKRSIAEARAPRLEYRIVRPDGAVRWVETRGTVHVDGYGAVTGASGVTFDVTERREAQGERDALQQRLSLLAEVTTTLSSSLDIDAVVARLSRLLVPRIADANIVYLAAPGGRNRQVAVAAADPAAEQLLRRIEEGQPRARYPGTALSRVLATGRPVAVPDVSPAYLHAVLPPSLAAAYLPLGMTSLVAAPLTARNVTVGVLTLVTTERSRRRLGPADADLALEIGRRAGLALDNARLYTVEHRVAETLQRSLLPELPVLPGIEPAARYLAGGGSASQQVGGDWFDVFPLDDDCVGLAVGDVIGHDMAAAAAMAGLRGALRAYAVDGSPPGAVLDRLDHLAQRLTLTDLVTAVYCRLQRPGPDGGRRVTYANAGHPPPLVQLPDGRVQQLDGAVSLVMGVPGDLGPRAEAGRCLPAGSTLLLYTDGLVEVPGESIDAGIARLRAAVAAVDPAGGPQRLCDHVLDVLGTEQPRDDVAVLAVRVASP